MWIKVRVSISYYYPWNLTRHQGGDAVWGNVTQAPDDKAGIDNTHGELISFRKNAIEIANDDTLNMTASTASSWILERTPSYFQVRSIFVVDLLLRFIGFQRMLATNYSYGIERDEKNLKRNNDDHTKWTNPLEIQCVFIPSSAPPFLDCRLGSLMLPQPSCFVSTGTGRRLK